MDGTEGKAQADLAHIEQRLMAEYGPTLGRTAVMTCLSDAVAHFHDAPVRNYLLLLIERRATTQLRQRAADAAGAAGAAPVKAS
jgi:hypothetical protein